MESRDIAPLRNFMLWNDVLTKTLSGNWNNGVHPNKRTYVYNLGFLIINVKLHYYCRYHY
jgi:hypothetical protein